MRSDLDNIPKGELIILASNYYATLKKVSKLYIKAKIDNKYLKRRNEILEKRLDHLTEMWAKKIGSTITFKKIDSIIRKEKNLNRKRGDKKNGNAKV